MVDVIIAVAAKVAEQLVVPIGKHILYPFKYKSNVEELTKQVEKLTDQRDTVQHSVDEAKRQGDEIEKKVEKWMHSVDEFTNGVVKPIIDDQVKAGKLCSIGFCPNLMARYSLSRKAAKTTEKGVDLLGEGTFEKVSYRPLLQKTTSIYVRGYGDFDSRKQVFNDLMKAVTDTDVNLIGVYGMGGVGKTTLVKRIVGQAIRDKLFDVVVMADVTGTPDTKSIQGQIADELGIKLEEESLPGRAARLRDQLRNKLKQEKRVLLVLDNIWAKLDLEEVGIPLGEEKKRSAMQKEYRKGRNDDQLRCKILLISRREYVLSNDMNTEKNFFIETLSDEEAGNLFWKIAGQSEEKPDLDPIAVEIVKKCAGLPVAIATIASALKKKSLSIWKNALDQLRTFNPRSIQGMDANVYSTIKLSYNFLESEEAKSLFLLHSVFAASDFVLIDDLLKYGVGWGLFQDVHTMEQRRNKLHTLIDTLKASCLLLDNSDNSSRIKMHDIIHIVAVSIASTEKLMFNIQNITGLKEMLEENLSKDAMAVSLPYGDICELPERLELPKLKLLYLCKKDLNLLQISDTFFKEVKELKVLHLTKFLLSSLPSSLQLLTNLQTLSFEWCVLGDIATIGALTKLKVLSLKGSHIEQLPGEIRQLIQLRFLDMSDCPKLKIITPCVISSLTRLEELYMGNTFVQWDINGQSNASLTELKQLSHLTSLEIHILDVHIMPQNLFSGKLDRYRIFIGDVWDWFGNYETSKTMKLKWSNRIYLGNGITPLLNKTEDLYLDELKDVKNVLYELDREGFPQLKHLHVQNGPDIQYIINSVGLGLSTFFPKLESLFLHNLINLEKTCHGQLAKESFSKLRIVKVEKCDRLKHLFSFSMANNLLKLQEIEVTNCKKLEEIVFMESKGQVHQNKRTERIEFSQLRTLTLQSLPQLTSFGFNKFIPNTGDQEILAEDELDGCMPLFGQNVLLPGLENLKLSSINIECLWLDQLPGISSCCQTLTSLILEECCGNLKFLFSYSMVKSLRLLETFMIRNCKSIEGIINTEELRLNHSEVLGFRNLKLMKVDNCSSLRYMFTPSVILGLVQLQELEIKNCAIMEEIITMKGENDAVAIGKITFLQLNCLVMDSLPNLTSFYSGSNTLECPSLTTININDCPKMETFVFTHLKDSCTGIAPLFGEKVEVPTLASSSIASQTIWHNQLQAHSVCFHNLTMLTIYDCHNLKYLFPISVAESLNHLELIIIWKCMLMERVIITREERKSSTLFPKLKQLCLDDLPELTRFCNFNGNSIELPSLSGLIIRICPKMQTFASNSLPGIEEPEEVNTEIEENLHSLFDEKVVLPTLASIILSSIRIQTIWHNQLQPMSPCFQNLKQIIMDGCDTIKHGFPSSMVESLVQLENLTISDCKLMEVIFEELNTTEDVETAPRLVFPQLTCLLLSDLPSLRSLSIGCLLKHGFPSLALGLVQLQKLEIKNCAILEVIAVIEEETVTNNLFPNLNELKLVNLLELSSFCNFAGNAIELPSLTRLWIENCPNMQTFISNFTGEDMSTTKDKRLTDIQPFFDEKIRLPNLVCLRLQKMDTLRKIWHHQLGSNSFSKLVALGLHDCHNVLTVCPSNMFGRLQNLEGGLWITNCSSLYEIFELQASSCGKTQAITATQNLPILEVIKCGNLKCLVPSFASFKNLTTLEVSKCDRLLNLVVVSTAKSMMQLTKLSISKCERIEEIIIHEGDEVEDIIIFKKLSCLELQCLPNLTSFYSGNYITEFPSLEQLVVRECPNMKTFSQGVLRAPRLDGLQITEIAEGKGYGKGNLDTTIEHLFIEKGQSSKED